MDVAALGWGAWHGRRCRGVISCDCAQVVHVVGSLVGVVVVSRNLVVGGSYDDSQMCDQEVWMGMEWEAFEGCEE